MVTIFNSEFLGDFLTYIHVHNIDVYSMRDELVAITENKGIEPKDELEAFKTKNTYFCYKFKKAKQLLTYPDTIKIARCPGVTLLCKGGILIAKEPFNEKSFTPFRLLLFWSVGFTGLHFVQQGAMLHQWRCFSWGVPQEKDIIDLDKWNIPGELKKHNDKTQQTAQFVVAWLKNIQSPPY